MLHMDFDIKIASVQVLISDQGVGKGMVFSTLMMGIMQELGLHVTNFDSVVNRFNDELSMKSYVLIDEGVMIDAHKVSFQCCV